MDRRQRKTRQAIFKAFILLLEKKNFNNITVGEIIDIADVGRATFYSHFETKDYLLKELCAELFDHVFDAENSENQRFNIFHCESNDSVFLHLFRHVQKNDNKVCKLLSSENNDLFLEYFKSGVLSLVKKCKSYFEDKKPQKLPEDFWLNHIATTFISTLKWWINNGLKQTPEEITEYFLLMV